MAPKSVWRGPNAKHFNLVYRSQQDPLAYDAEASQGVLQPVARQGQNRAQLEEQLGNIAKQERSNVGEAAQYGIYFDDTQYDYMQHLRAVGGNDNSRRGGQDEERDTDVILLEAPQKKQSTKPKGKASESFGLKAEMKENDIELPPELLPSKDVLPRAFEQDRQGGIQPDMDPHLRQALEALDDDAFLMRTAGGNSDRQLIHSKEQESDMDQEDADENIDDFFDDIIKGGELSADSKLPEWRDLPPEGEESLWMDPSARAARELLTLKEQGKGVEELSLESRVALFKKAAAERDAKQRDDDDDSRPLQGKAPSSTGSKSIFGEKGATRKSRHPGAKARLAGSFYAPSSAGGSTAFSMSSSAMERNRGLTDLDDQFARMEKIYEDEEDSDDDVSAREDGAAPEDPRNVDAIFDDFLSKNEIIGNRMRERLGELDSTPIDKVNLLREELGALRLIDRQTWEEAEAAGLGPQETVEELISRDLAQRAQTRRDHDVETIQTTRTNVAHRPRTIPATQSVAPSRVSHHIFKGQGEGTDMMPRVKIDPRTGATSIKGYIKLRPQNVEQTGNTTQEPSAQSDDEGQDDDADDASVSSDHTAMAERPTTVRRDRNESKEEKRERKKAAKQEKQERRVEKAHRRAQFKQAAAHGNSTVRPNEAFVSL